MLLLTSSASIPGELLVLLLHLLLSLLLLLVSSSLPGRLRIEHPAKVLDRPCPAERGRPGEVAAKVDELGQVVIGETLVGDCPVHVGDQCGCSGHDCSSGSRGLFSSLPLASLPSNDAAKAVRLVIGVIVAQCSHHYRRP